MSISFPSISRCYEELQKEMNANYRTYERSEGKLPESTRAKKGADWLNVDS